MTVSRERVWEVRLLGENKNGMVELAACEMEIVQYMKGKRIPTSSEVNLFKTTWSWRK
jgi:hypothetical protein